MKINANKEKVKMEDNNDKVKMEDSPVMEE